MHALLVGASVLPVVATGVAVVVPLVGTAVSADSSVVQDRKVHTEWMIDDFRYVCRSTVSTAKHVSS